MLLQQLKQFLVPIVALVVFGGRGERYEWISLLVTLAAILGLVAVSVLRYLTYRYRIDTDGIAIRSGWLHRSRRDIPFARIHNVGVHQSALHRLFGVAEVRLESAGGDKPEAEMRVLRLDQALALEQLVRHRGQAVPTEGGQAPGEELLALSPGEIVRLGLISNRGMVVVAAAFGVLYQMFPERQISDFVEHHGEQAYRYVEQLHPGVEATALFAAFALVVVLALMRLLSVMLALLQYHGFRLSESERRLTVERGLLTRLRTSVARRRIQAWTLQEGVLHRLFGRRQLRVDTAVSESQGEEGRALKELAPIATPQACNALVHRLLPGAHWPPPSWHPVATRCWWRLSLPSLWLLPLAAVLFLRFGAWSLLVLAWWPWSMFRAWHQVRRMGYALDERYVAVRGGWWTRWWRFAEVGKLQALRLVRSPLDRLTGTATLWLDTAGATGNVPPLRLRFIPLAAAQALYARLGTSLARRRLEW
ncbi:membrane protein [[Pseudomonas] boreopolis]|uniref:Membrane protein n=1 Tax=Xanthomonas boreopolis TaxID=86183 RepID=A0A919KIY9_9XANT|nr:membrane protein [[Pseudomonas] boreopolis]